MTTNQTRYGTRTVGGITTWAGSDGKLAIGSNVYPALFDGDASPSQLRYLLAAADVRNLTLVKREEEQGDAVEVTQAGYIEGETTTVTGLITSVAEVDGVTYVTVVPGEEV
jgi:hypothetical protein